MPASLPIAADRRGVVVTGLGLVCPVGNTVSESWANLVEGRSGIWLPADDTRPERKVGQIGIRVSQGVTMHGFALNCDNDLVWFDRIVPCGITDASAI